MSDNLQTAAPVRAAEPTNGAPPPVEEPRVNAAADVLAGDWSDGLRGPIREHGLPPPARITARPAPVAAKARSEVPLPLPAQPADGGELRTEQADVRALMAAAAEVEAGTRDDVPSAWASLDEPLASEPPPVAAGEPAKPAVEEPAVVVAPEPAAAVEPSPPPEEITPAAQQPVVELGAGDELVEAPAEQASDADEGLSGAVELTDAEAVDAGVVAEPAAEAPAQETAAAESEAPPAEAAAPEAEPAPAPHAIAAAHPSPVEDAEAWGHAFAAAAPGEPRAPGADPSPFSDTPPAAAAGGPTPWSEPSGTALDQGWGAAAAAPPAPPPPPAAADPWAVAPVEGPAWSEKTATATPPATADDSWSVPAQAEAEPDWTTAGPSSAAAAAPAPAAVDDWAPPPLEAATPLSPPKPVDPWGMMQMSDAPASDGALMPELSGPGFEPGAAGASLFAPLPAGASLSGDDDTSAATGAPEARSAAAVPDGDEDLLVPVEETPAEEPLEALPEDALEPLSEAPEAQAPALSALDDAPAAPQRPASLVVQGEHRVVVHTRAGRTKRGTLRDVDLSRQFLPLQPQGGGPTESVPATEVKAVFFMLPAGEKPPAPSGGKVRVTFNDGRTVDGHRDGPDAAAGFFMVPLDAARTNTRFIFVAREAVQELKES